MQRKTAFEDFTLGETIEAPGVTVTPAMIIEFALTYDPQPIHIDVEASNAGPYGALIASGWQTLAFGFRMLVQAGVFDAGLGSPGVDNVKWQRPVYANDTLRTTAKVTAVRPSASKPDRGVLGLHVDIANQRGEVVCSADGSFFIRRRTA